MHGEEITINCGTDWENALLDHPLGGLTLALQGLVHHKTKEQKEKERFRFLALEQEEVDIRKRRLQQELHDEKQRCLQELHRAAERERGELQALQDKYYKNLEGNLHKKSPNLLKLWQKRFFCLDDKKAKLLQYWGDRAARDKGKAAVGTIAVEHMLHCRAESARRPNKFIIETTERVFQLQAESFDFMNEWVAVISKFIEIARIENVIAAKGVAAMAQHAADDLPDREVTLFDIFQEAEQAASTERMQQVAGQWLVVAASKAMAQHPLHASMRLPPSSLLPSSSAWDDAGVFCSLDESAYCINWCKKKQARHKANPDGTISLERFVQAVRYFDPEASDGKSTASSSVFTMRLYHEGTYFFFPKSGQHDSVVICRHDHASVCVWAWA
jgi:hypothetical protein